jgi:hypothetical protein
MQGGQPIQFEDAALTPIALCCLALVCGQVGAHESYVRVSNLQPNANTTLVHANTAAAAANGNTSTHAHCTTETHAHCTTEKLHLNSTVLPSHALFINVCRRLPDSIRVGHES